MDHIVQFREKEMKKAENSNLPLLNVLEIAFEYVNQEGFISIVSEESGGVVSTSTRVRNWFQDREASVLKKMNQESEDNAKKCKSWVLGWDIEIVDNEVDTFSNRVYEIFLNGSVIGIQEKYIPMVCGVIPNFLYKGKELSYCINSEFVGEINQDYKGFVKLMKYDYNNEKEYYTFKCRDKKGNIIFFWDNSDIIDNHNLSIGDCFTFKGIVDQKINSEYDNGLMATRFKKVKIIKNYGKPK